MKTNNGYAYGKEKEIDDMLRKLTNEEVFKIKTVDGELYVFPIARIFRWDLEYSPQIARFDFKDGAFIEFTRRNIVCIAKEKRFE